MLFTSIISAIMIYILNEYIFYMFSMVAIQDYIRILLAFTVCATSIVCINGYYFKTLKGHIPILSWIMILKDEDFKYIYKSLAVTILIPTIFAIIYNMIFHNNGNLNFGTNTLYHHKMIIKYVIVLFSAIQFKIQNDVFNSETTESETTIISILLLLLASPMIIDIVILRNIKFVITNITMILTNTLLIFTWFQIIKNNETT